MTTGLTLNAAWKGQLIDVMTRGKVVQPRGLVTKELPQKTLTFDMNYPVITWPERKLGYRFLAAEAWWLLSGRKDVASIAPYSRAISRFSDNGLDFFGSYGPPFAEQLPYVVASLSQDVFTRQATMTFWRQNPPRTKDVPCTVALTFLIRDGRLNLHVYMRSSDNWLGIPYDAFNFTMMACRVLELYNVVQMMPQDRVRLGTCYLTAASSHLYDRDFALVNDLFKSPLRPPPTHAVPAYLFGIYDTVPEPVDLIQYLDTLKDITTDEDDRRWWVWRDVS